MGALIDRDVDADGKVVCSQRVALVDHRRCMSCVALRDVQLASEGEIRAVRCAAANAVVTAG